MKFKIRNLSLALALALTAGAVHAQDAGDAAPAVPAHEASDTAAGVHAHDAGDTAAVEHAHDGGDGDAAPVLPARGAGNQAENQSASPLLDTPHDPSAPNPAPVHPELAGVFADFGGMPGMTALMEDFMAIMLADPRLRRFFENIDQVRTKRLLAEQFCAILGGGCAYSGRDMKTTHAAFAIDRANFNALVEDLQVAMNRKRIPFRSQNKLLAVLAPMHREAVTR